MKGDYTRGSRWSDLGIVRDDPHMKGDYTPVRFRDVRDFVRDDPQMKETYTLRCFATLSMTIGGLG